MRRQTPARRRAPMRRRGTVQAVFLVVIVLLAGVVGVQLAAALPREKSTPTPVAVDWATVRPGADASWPACRAHGATRTLPTLASRPSFVVVGLNDGLPGTVSGCIARELAWSRTTTGGSSQPPLAYYVLAADPWTAPERKWVRHPAWPSSDIVAGTAVPVPAAFASARSGTRCTGGRTERACAFVYGWAMARHAAAIRGLPDPSRHRFWIDVEAERTWSDDPRFNQAVVEGMVAAFTLPRSAGGVGTTTGIYSDHSEWARIIGPLRTGSPLDRLDEWVAIGPATKAAAIDALLHDWPITPGGRIRVVQWLEDGLDRDVARPR